MKQKPNYQISFLSMDILFREVRIYGERNYLQDYCYNSPFSKMSYTSIVLWFQPILCTLLSFYLVFYRIVTDVQKVDSQPCEPSSTHPRLNSIYHLAKKERMHVYQKYFGTVVKNPPANAGDTGSSPGPGRSHMLWSNQARAPQLLRLRSRDRFAGQKQRHRCREQTYGHQGGKVAGVVAVVG